MNAQIGREEMYQPTIGNQGFHQETNDTGRLVNFAAFRNMVIGSTMFEHNLMDVRTEVLIPTQVTSWLFHECDVKYLTLKNGRGKSGRI
jgi:hypothetical protein